MRYIVGLYLFACFLLVGAKADASTSQAGVISDIVAQRQGQLFFNTNGARTSPASCQTAGTRWVISLSTAGGQAIASTIITAYAAGKSITVNGTGACEDWPDTESVEFIHVVN